MNPKRLVRIGLRTVVGLVVSVAAVLLVVRSISVSQTAEAIGSAQWSGIGLVMAAIACDIAVRAWRWRALLRPIRPLSVPTVAVHLLIGYLANNALPARLGELARSHTLGRSQAVSRAAIVGTVAIERILDVVALVLLSAVAVVLVPSGEVLTAVVGTAVVLSALLLLVLALAVRGVMPTPAWIAARIRASAMGESLRRLRQGLRIVVDRRALLEGAAATIVAWAFTAIAFAAAAGSLGMQLSVAEVLLFAAGVNLATIVPAGPAYLGTFELAAASVAAAVGVSPVSALAMAIIVHVVIATMTTLGGLVALGSVYLVPRRLPRTALAAEPMHPDDGG